MCVRATCDEYNFVFLTAANRHVIAQYDKDRLPKMTEFTFADNLQK